MYFTHTYIYHSDSFLLINYHSKAYRETHKINKSKQVNNTNNNRIEKRNVVVREKKVYSTE
jgi:hypothetical protein